METWDMSMSFGDKDSLSPSTMRGREWPCLRQFAVVLENRVGSLHQLLRHLEGHDLRVIALSIVFVAVEIVHKRRGRESLTARAPWIVALVFGLLHGFGFAGALREVGLPEHAIPLALFLFNIGVEVGQLLFVACVLVLIYAARIPLALAQRWATPVPAYAIGTVAAFWTLQRIISLG